jgi:hypothetical protein
MESEVSKEREIQYRWKIPGGQFNAWQRWGRYASEAIRDVMLASRRDKYLWSDRFEFRAAK